MIPKPSSLKLKERRQEPKRTLNPKPLGVGFMEVCGMG